MSRTPANADAERFRFSTITKRRIQIGSVAAVLLILVVYPLGDLLRSVLSAPSSAWHSIDNRSVVVALLHTLLISAAATVAATAIGVVMAVLVARSDLPLRRWFAGLWLAPLVVPAYVTGLAWLDAYTTAGLTTKIAHVSAGWISGPGGVVLLLALQGVPLAYLFVLTALNGGNISELEDAACIAGRPPLRILIEVTLPLIKSAIVGSILLVFVSSASDFGIPAVLAIPSGFSTVTTLIYSDLSFAGGASAISSAAALSGLLGVFAIIIVVGANRFSRKATVIGHSQGASRSSRPLVCFGRFRWLGLLVSSLFVIFTTLIPLVSLFLTSVSPDFQLDLWPGKWVASAYRQALSGDNFGALGRSALISVIAALVVAVGGALVVLVLRHSQRMSNTAAAVFALPFALPGSVVAIAVLIAWQRWLYGTLLIIFLAYIARFAIVGLRTSMTAVSAMSEELVLAARSSGASPIRASLDVVWPTLRPGIVTSFVIVVLMAIHELTMSSLLYGPATKTFAVEVLAAEEAGEVALTAALAILITAITVVVAFVALSARSNRRLVSAQIGLEVPSWQ